MADVTPLIEWRQRRDQHTREVVKESVPEGYRRALELLADRVESQAGEIERLRAALTALAEEASKA